MKIEILPPARFDLIDGYWFYEEQETGLGGYFLESIGPILSRSGFIPESTRNFMANTGW